jgi:hypothetical protein
MHIADLAALHTGLLERAEHGRWVATEELGHLSKRVAAPIEVDSAVSAEFMPLGHLRRPHRFTP